MGLRPLGGPKSGQRLAAGTAFLGVTLAQLAMASASPHAPAPGPSPSVGGIAAGPRAHMHPPSSTPKPEAAPGPPAPPQPEVRFTAPHAGVAAAPNIATVEIPGPAGVFSVPYIQSQPDLSFAVKVAHVRDAVVQVVLDEGSPGAQEVWVASPAYSGRFPEIGWGEHRLAAHLFNRGSLERRLPQRELASTELVQVARGDIVALLGDSTTEGLGDGPLTPAQNRVLVRFPDWLAARRAEAASASHWVSPDGRNFPQAGPTLQPQSRPAATVALGELLAAARGRPALVLNSGFSGTTSVAYTHVTGSAFMRAEFAVVRPNLFLVDLGVNDALEMRPAADFAARMATIVGDLEHIYGVQPADIHLACPSWAAQEARNRQEATYLPVIDSLRGSGGLGASPDFFRQFRDNPGLLADSVHPNAAGYAAMARSWAAAAGGAGARCA